MHEIQNAALSRVPSSMPIKKNPLRLNPLQLKTLTLLQELARLNDRPAEVPEGGFVIGPLPHAHGNHFHLGRAVVASADATGLENQSVWLALERKKLVDTAGPQGPVLTADGVTYDTGLREAILHRSDH